MPLLIVFISIFLTNCFPYNMRGVKIEKDEIKNSKRYTYEDAYPINENNTGIVFFGKTFFREVDSVGINKTKVYDFIEFNKSQDKGEVEIYLATDSKTFKIHLDNLAIEDKKSFKTDTEDIMKADSTKVKVITDYDVHYYQIFKLNYTLDNEMIESILKSNSLKFRYYIGIRMITVEVKGEKLNNVKKTLKKEVTDADFMKNDKNLFSKKNTIWR